jgi:uncharacterized protein HemX
MDEQNNVNVEGTSSSGSSAGLITGIIVILAIIILGGLYFWKQRSINEMMTDGTVESINTQSELDDTASIEADLNSTDVDNLDAELNAS